MQLHHPRFLKCVGAPESARLLTRSPSHWVANLDRDNAVWAALQLQHLQVLGQFVTSLNRMSSEVMRLAFGEESFPLDAMNAISPVPQAHRAAHYMASMGLWRSLGGPCDPGPLPMSACDNCRNCADCFPELERKG